MYIKNDILGEQLLLIRMLQLALESILALEPVKETLGR